VNLQMVARMAVDGRILHEQQLTSMASEAIYRLCEGPSLGVVPPLYTMAPINICRGDSLDM